MVNQTTYAPYGREASNQGTGDVAYKFTDKEKDGTGWVYFGARYYDPEVGRFVSVDPAKDGGNWYCYCFNNPVKYVDPTGLKVYGFGIGANAFVALGGKLSVSVVFDNKGNYGVLVSGGVGFGVEGSGKFSFDTVGVPLGNNATIYDLVGKDAVLGIMNVTGMEMSASFIVSATFNDNSQLCGIGIGPSFGGSLSWNGAVLIPVSDGVKGVNDAVNYVINLMKELAGGIEETNHSGETNKVGYGEDSGSRQSVENRQSFGDSGSSAETGSTDRPDNSEGSDSSAAGNGSIICAELFRQGLMDKNIFIADEKFGDLLKEKHSLG